MRMVGGAAVGAAVVALAGCSSSASHSAPAATRIAQSGGSTASTAIPANEKPVAPEHNPVGDIPDTQTFVSYTSTAGNYTVDAPEGWSRTESGAEVKFVSAFDGEQVAIASTAAAPTAATARGAEAAAIERAGRAVQISNITDVQLTGAPAVLIAYTANSAPDAVTGKQVRLEEHAYLFYKNGNLATLTLWAPQGADNTDQWLRIANSFRWS